MKASGATELHFRYTGEIPNYVSFSKKNIELFLDLPKVLKDKHKTLQFSDPRFPGFNPIV